MVELMEWTETMASRKNEDERLLSDDLLKCPMCRGDSIAYCNTPNLDTNANMKAAIAKNPNARGGKIKKTKNIEKIKKPKNIKRKQLKEKK